MEGTSEQDIEPRVAVCQATKKEKCIPKPGKWSVQKYTGGARGRGKASPLKLFTPLKQESENPAALGLEPHCSAAEFSLVPPPMSPKIFHPPETNSTHSEVQLIQPTEKS